MKCYIPSKIKKDFTKINKGNTNNLITEIDEDFGRLLLKEIAKICNSSVFKEWFYKICPLKSAWQILTFKRKNEFGVEFTETNLLGKKPNITEDINYNDDTLINKVYTNYTGDTTSFDGLSTIPMALTKDRVIYI
jgi:hypothetical protein